MGAGDDGEDEYTNKVDIYSLGLVILRLLKLSLPHDSLRTERSWRRSIWAMVQRELLHTRSQDYKGSLNTALAMAAFDPKDRPRRRRVLRLAMVHYHEWSWKRFEMAGVPDIGPSRRMLSPPVEEMESENSTEIIGNHGGQSRPPVGEAGSEDLADNVQSTKKRKRATGSQSGNEQTVAK